MTSTLNVLETVVLMKKTAPLLCLTVLAACGPPPDPSIPENSDDNSTTFNSSNSSSSNSTSSSNDDVAIKNLSVKVFDNREWDGCDAVAEFDDACPAYELTFSLENNSDLATDRVNGMVLSFDGGEPEVDLNFTCDLAPWVVEAGGNSTVIDVKFSYSSEGFGGPEFGFSCGAQQNSTSSFERETIFFDTLTLGGPGPIEGELELELTGLFADASNWSATATTSF